MTIYMSLLDYHQKCLVFRYRHHTIYFSPSILGVIA